MWRRGTLAFLLVGQLTGCLDPRFVRFPEPFPIDTRMEAMSYRFHDPFPDTSAGPNTYSRPPSYQQQRAPARRSSENRLLLGLKQRPGMAAPTPPRAANAYPLSVQTE